MREATLERNNNNGDVGELMHEVEDVEATTEVFEVDQETVENKKYSTDLTGKVNRKKLKATSHERR